VAGLWNRLVGSREYIRVNINTQTFNFIPHYRSITPDHEPSVWFALENIMKEADCFLDVGANIGIYTLLATKTMKSTGAIISFEPNPAAFKVLQKHTSYNPGSIVPSIKNAALYDGTVDKITIQADTNHIADPECQITFADNAGDLIPCLSLDSLSLSSDRILIKIDVEGAETGVLRGARKLLTSKKEIAIVLAVHPQQLKNFGETMQSLQAEIKKNNLLTMDMSGKPVDELSGKLDEYICTNSREWFASLTKLMAGNL
jgi:FkbM family methyltransferase